MKGKYFLDEIDNLIYSTDSYEIYCLYHNCFNNVDIMQKEEYYSDKEIDTSTADREQYLNALREIQLFYENDYVPKRILTKKGWTRTLWIKNPEKAAFFLSHSKIIMKMGEL